MATAWTYDHWSKEKQNLKFVGKDGRTYSYDFATNAWTGLSGKRLSEIPKYRNYNKFLYLLYTSQKIHKKFTIRVRETFEICSPLFT